MNDRRMPPSFVTSWEPTPAPQEDTQAGLSTTAPVALPTLARDFQNNPTASQARYGCAFLLHDGPLDAQSRLARAQVTMVADTRRLDLLDHPPAPLPIIAYPMRRTGRSPFPHFITAGRAKSNDVVLGDFSVSKFHAFFQQDEEGGFWLVDSRSKNGTFVNDHPVPVHTRGDPIPLESGALVRFGAVELTFVMAGELLDFARRKL